MCPVTTKGRTMAKKRIVVFFIVLLLLLQLQDVVPVRAELIPVQTELRVGLTSMYSGKESLKINNIRLGYGYCVGNAYLQEAELISPEGFLFTPVNGYFVSETSSYGSYQAAKQAAEVYVKLGIQAYPGSSYQCKWKVYFGNTSRYADAETLKKLVAEKTGKNNLEVLSGNNYRMLLSGSFGQLLIDVDEHYAYPQFRPLTEYKNGVYCVDMGSRVYRGRMEIGRYGKATLTAVNIVSMEEYLYGVVPSEMSSSWHEEALKAQAVCARSYALVKAGYGGASNAKSGYKIVDTTSSQVYKGYLSESVKASKAVDATRGEMVCYKDKVVAAYFSSTSGGRTEASADVWAVDLPYLQSVPDLYEYNPDRESWIVVRTKGEITSMLAGQGISVGTVKEIASIQYSGSGRVEALNVTGNKRSLTVQGTTIRTVLNLYSTKFKIVRKGDIPDQVTILGADDVNVGRISNMYIASAEGVAKASAELSQYIVQGSGNLWNYPSAAPDSEEEILFAGMGYGHGVGMSQYGAKGMAEAGYTYKEIVEYYFTGAKVR